MRRHRWLSQSDLRGHEADAYAILEKITVPLGRKICRWVHQPTHDFKAPRVRQRAKNQHH